MRRLRAALAFALAAAAGCDEAPAPRGGEVQVLLVGLDGASWNLIEPMLARGALPHLERLMAEGVTAPMRSELPCLSIVLWTSVATGKRPEEHGIEDWSFVDPETGEKSLVNSRHRRVEAIWNILTSAGRGVGFVNWWATWPAEPVSGFIVSEQFTRKRKGQSLEDGTFPDSLADELGAIWDDEEWPWLRERLADGSLKVLSDRDGNGKNNLEERYRQAFFLYGQDYRGERSAFHLLEDRGQPALLGYLSRKIDIASHYMWQFTGESRPSFERISRRLEPVYRYEDELLGRLISAGGPDVNVIVVSDHGFAWEGESFGHEETAPDGIFVASGPAFRRGARLDDVSLYDITPTLLHLLGLPVAEDMAGTPLLHALENPLPPSSIATYETGARGPATGPRSPLEERILKELESLGYVH